MPVVVAGLDLERLEADDEVRAKLVDAVEESCLEMIVRSSADAPHTRKFWTTRLRAKPIGVVAETAVAGLDAADATSLSLSEEFLDVVLEKVSGVPRIRDFLLPGATLFVLKETTTATSTTRTFTSTTETSSTSTTTTLPSPEEAAKALFGAVEETSASLLGALEGSNESTVVAALPDGGTMAVSKLGDALADALAGFAELDAREAPRGGSYSGGGSYSDGGGSYSSSGEEAVEREVPSVEVEVPGTGVDVALPLTMFASLQATADVAPADIAMVVTAFDPESVNIKGMGRRPDPEQGGVRVEVAGAATIDLKNLASGVAVSVSGLRDPIKFSLPTNFTPGMKCSYWDEQKQVWSTKGVWAAKSSVVGERIVCKTRHLSLFGALVETVVETLECANVLNLMNKEALLEILTGDWITSPGSVMFACIILMLGLNYIAAALVDYRRWRLHHFTDEFLLVYLGPAFDPPTPQRGSSARDLLVGSLCSCCLWLQESEVLRQAVDDIASNWFQFFGEIRTGVEACVDCVGTDIAAIGRGMAGLFTGKLMRLSHRVTAKMMLFVSRRTAAASLGMTEDVVSFVLDNEDLADYLISDRSQGNGGNWRRTPDQRSAIAGLREEVNNCMVRLTVKQGSTRPQFLKTVLRLMLTQNPLGALFVLDIFSSCKQRALIFSVEMLGAITVSCVFFEASGMAKGKAKAVRGQGGCGGGDDEGGMPDLTASLGRFLVIAMACLLIAGLPVHVLSSLQTKRFKIMRTPPGSEAWRRQLRAWQFQERLVTVLGMLYISLCIIYIVMFVANIGDQDQQEWSFMGFLTFFQDVLLLPFLTAFTVPMFAQVLLMLHLFISGTSRERFVRSVCELLHNNSNAMLPIERI